jgi:FSR family fosmidomycin resistance protein-like MFS transporter
MDKPENNKFQFNRVFDISMGHFLHDVYSSFLTPLLPIFIERFGLSYFLATSLSLYGRIPSLFNWYIGILADKIRIRYFVIVMPAVTAISMSLLGLSQNYWQLSILLFIMGWAAAFFHVPGPVLIRRVSGNRSGLGMSFYMVGGELARTLGPLFITSAVSWWGLEGSWRVMPVGILASIILFFRLRNLKKVDFKPKTKNGNAKDELFRNAKLYSAITGYTFSRGLVRGIFVTLLPTYVIFKGGSLWDGTYALMIIQFAGAVGTMISGGFSDRFGRKTALLFIAIISPLLLLSYNYTDGITNMVILALIGLFIFGSNPILLALVQDLKTDRPSFNNGIYMTISFAFGAPAGLLVGLLADKTSLDAIYLFAPLFAAIAIPFTLMLPKTES